MIMVNHRPPTDSVFSPFLHAEWTGWTLADTVFPMFLFIVGLSISYFHRPQPKHDEVYLYARIVRRSALLIVIGILLANFPYYELEKLQIHGTLQRIGICYLAVALINRFAGLRTHVAIIIVVLATYHWLLVRFHVPDFGPGVLTPEGNVSTYLDSLILGDYAQHFQRGGPVTQGLLPTASAIASTLAGLVAGYWLKHQTTITSQALGLFAVGFLFLCGGALWSLLVPISKPLWTPSYVVLMVGVAAQVLAFLYWVHQHDLAGILQRFFQIAGANAITFFVLAQIFQRVLVYGRIPLADGSTPRLRYLIYEHAFQSWLPGKIAALAYTLCFLAICYAVIFEMYRKRVFIKL